MEAGDSVIFTEYLAGNGNGVVTKGFAANWSISGEECAKINKRLIRNVKGNADYFMSDHLIGKIMNLTSFNDLTSPWNDELEMKHGLVHSVCGGHMADTLCSPNDPLFFFHHCGVDHIYEKWKKKTLKLYSSINYDTNRPIPMNDKENKDYILSDSKSQNVLL